MNQLKATIRLAIPVIIGQLGQVLLGFTDSVMVGRLGATELAASSFVLNIFSSAFVLFIGMSTGISARVSQSLGANKKMECGHYLMNGLLVSFIFVVLLMMGLFSLTPFLSAFKQDPQVTLAAGPFYVLIVWSLLPLFVYFSYKQFLDGLGRTVSPTMVTFLGLVVNFVLNYVLIFGHWGFPKLGLVGSGFATLISRTVMGLVLMGYVHLSGRFKIYLPKFNLQFSRARIIDILKIGLPSAFQYFFEVVAFSGAGILMGWISLEALAAHQIAINLASATFMVAVGISIAASVRVGRAYGAKNFSEMRIIGFGALCLIGGLELIFAVMFIVGRHFFPTIYIDDPQVLKIAGTLMIIAGFFQLFDGVQSVAIGILRGMSDVKIPMAITLSAYWVVGLPLCYWLAFKMQLNEIGVWVGLAISLLFSSTLLSLRFWRLSYKRRHTTFDLPMR